MTENQELLAKMAAEVARAQEAEMKWKIKYHLLKDTNNKKSERKQNLRQLFLQFIQIIKQP